MSGSGCHINNTHSNKSPYESPNLNFDELANSIIEQLRITSDLKYSNCKQIVESIVSSLSNNLPHEDLEKLLCSVRKDVIEIENCYDARQMSRLMDAVSEWCTDHQERNWSLLEDEMQMTEAILDLNSHLEKADSRVSFFVIATNDFKALGDLVSLYNLTLKLSCLLSPKIPNILLTTILPAELVQNLNTAFINGRSDSDDIYLAIDILALLFCNGESIQCSLYDVFNVEFMRNVLDQMEKVRPDGELVSKLSNFLISFNLHQAKSSENIIVDAISEASCKNFIDRLLYLVNRGIDPVWPYDILDNPHGSSPIIMLTSIMSSGASASVIYSNDLLVVFNIIQREILNQQPGKIRKLFHDLLRQLIVNGDKDFVRENKNEIDELINLGCDS